ncbi:MAG: sigma-54-dependent Fis family transcriptional regulator [Planctomycetes bacterium]|nr:sigma-54-dependent Fis family transcriptional regulator [Planctomycetota bacterium]
MSAKLGLEDASLLEAIVKLAEERDLPVILERGMDLAIEMTGAARGYLFLFDGGSLDIQVARNLDRSRIDGPEVEFSHTVVKAIHDGTLPQVLADDIQEDPRFQSALSVRRLRLRSVLAFPVRNRDALVGAFYLDNPDQAGTFRHVHQSVLDLFSRFFGSSVARMRELERAREESERARREAAGGFRDLIGRSRKMERVQALLSTYVEAEDPVFLTGETGTGKEVVARIVHQEGRRRGGPFKALNCASLRTDLLEAELFGHSDVGFTGARRARAGLVEVASGGTLFLDEIELMSPDLQGTLLRFLDSGEFRRIGETQDRKADVRIVCATNERVEELIEKGRFRADLYYRVGVLELDLPPLRERSEDIADLADHFSRRVAESKGCPVKTFESGALERLEAHSWPGNVRELENFMKRVYVVVPEARVSANRVSELLFGKPARPEIDHAWGTPGALDRFLEVAGAVKTEEAHRLAGGNVSATARHLGISRDRVRQYLARIAAIFPPTGPPL